MPQIYYWFIIGIALMILELFTPGFFLLLTGIAAIITGGLSYLFPPDMIALQWILFGVFTILALVFLRKYLLNKTEPAETIMTNVDGLIGKKAVVIREIIPDSMKGQVKINGEIWIAQSENNSAVPVDEEVVVKKVSGTKLIVGRS